MNDVRIALLSVDHEDMEGYTVGLKALLEEHTVSVASFHWGAQNHKHAGRNNYRHHDDDREHLELYIPEAAAISVSMFMELMINTANNRPYEDRDQHKTWTFALYEVIDGKVGRIKLLDQCHFTRSALGRGQVGEGRSYGFPAHAGGPLNTTPTFGDAGSTDIGRTFDNVRYETVEIVARDLTANAKTREALQAHLHAGARAKTVKPKAVVADKK